MKTARQMFGELEAKGLAVACTIGIAALAGCGGSSELQRNVAPAGLRVMKTTVHGADNDLLTAGVGVPALADTASTLPTYADAQNPTAAELRRAAIARKFDKGSGEGVLWGTGFDPVSQKPVTGDGKVTGVEVLAYNDDGTGAKNVAMFVQIPDSFDVNNACVLVVAPASAARLHSDTGQVSWGLRRGCAVASSDKGGGNGVHDLTSNKAVLIDGVTADADAAGKDASYVTPGFSAQARADYLAKYPNRISAKYYGKRNRMSEQGEDMVAAAKFALFQLNEKFGDVLPSGGRGVRFHKDNTTIILVGSSSGGGGAMKGIEADSEGYFDGVVALYPAVNPEFNAKVSVTRGGITYPSKGISIADFVSMENIFMICAGRADPSWPGYANLSYGDNLCQSLKEKGLVKGNTPLEQAKDAARILVEYGFDPAGQWQFPSNGDLVGPLHAIANAYMQTGIERNLCNVTVALTLDAQGKASRPTAAQLAQMWVNTGTYAPQAIYEDAVGGPVHFTRGVSPSTGRVDGSLDAKLCLQALKTGTSAESQKYRAGELAAGHNANLRGRPTIIYAAREDVRLPATLTSRMYLGLNSVVEGASSRLRYYELTNTSHSGSNSPRLVSASYYLYSGLNLMWDYLKKGTPLPPHQVVRTVPRGSNPDGSTRDMTAANVPALVMAPAAADAITVNDGAVVIPD